MAYLTDLATKIKTWANNKFQEKLVSGTNLKTINNQSLLGSDNISIEGGGGHTIQDNGTSLTARTNLDIRGNYNLIKDDSTADATKLLFNNNLGKDWYINQNVYPALEWVWYHTDGYWYLVVNALSQVSGSVGATEKYIKILKTKDWITFDIVVSSYLDTGGYNIITPKITMDSNGNIVVVYRVDSTLLRSAFFNASNNYSVTRSNISENLNYSPETTISLNVSSDNRFGVAFFQKHAGSTSFSQLMYVERSAGTSGTWGTVEILGSTPVRAATTSSSAAPQLFYTSTNEPIIAFLNNQSATSSKVAIAKKVSGSWTIYNSIRTQLYSSSIDSTNKIYLASENITVFDYVTNSFSSLANVNSTTFGSSIDSNDNIYYISLRAILAATSIYNIFYFKNSDNTFHRAVRPYFQIGAVISANAYSTFGIYTVIPYSRQRLTNAYHLVVRNDGAIYMEVI